MQRRRRPSPGSRKDPSARGVGVAVWRRRTKASITEYIALRYDRVMAGAMTGREYQALAQFRHSLRVFVAFSEEAARSVGLTPAQHQLLLAVRGHVGGGAPAIGDLAAALQLRHHSTVELVGRAEAAGLVERHPDPTDQRRHRVTLTAA